MAQRNSLRITVFSDDMETETLCRKFSSCQHKRKKRTEWWAMQNVERVRTAMKHRLQRFSVPEFCDPEYISLTLCKFEALHDVSLETLDPCVWIDAGLRDYAFRDTVRIQIDTPQIYAAQFSPRPICEAWVYELPGSHIMAGCFGGRGVDVRRLFADSKRLLDEFWKRDISLSDQQTLSILDLRNPDRFRLRQHFTQWIPFMSRGHWNACLSILDHTLAETRHQPAVFVWCLLAFAAMVLLDKNVA